jgi:hypothetical protein
LSVFGGATVRGSLTATAGTTFTKQSACESGVPERGQRMPASTLRMKPVIEPWRHLPEIGSSSPCVQHE